MKRILLLIALLAIVLLPMQAQHPEGNPFARLGYHADAYTFGEDKEFHDQKELVEIGDVLFNTRTNKVVGFVEKGDSLIELKPELQSMSIDPLCEKYYSISPYAYCMNNPVRYIDMNGDSVSLSAIQQLDKGLNTSYTQTIINDLQSQTGLNITVSADGKMSYAKDANGNPIIGTIKDANGNVVQVGSKTARTLMVGAINHQDWVNVVPAGRSGVPTGSNELRLSIGQINKFVNGTVNLDNRTLGWGMTLMHELQHTQVGGGLSDAPYNPGAVVTQMNIIRSELNSQGGNYGQRLDYFGMPLGNSIYLPYDNPSKRLIRYGFPPLPINNYIRF